MIHIEYEIVTNTSSGTLVVVTAGNLTVHTIVSPIASTGTYTLKNAAFATVFVFPIGTIGTMLLDAVFPSGLSIVSSAADSVIVTYQKP